MLNVADVRISGQQPETPSNKAQCNQFLVILGAPKTIRAPNHHLALAS